MWATVSEVMPVPAKAFVGTFLAIAAAISSGKAFFDKRDERKGNDEDQRTG